MRCFAGRHTSQGEACIINVTYLDPLAVFGLVHDLRHRPLDGPHMVARLRLMQIHAVVEREPQAVSSADRRDLAEQLVLLLVGIGVRVAVEQ